MKIPKKGFVLWITGLPCTGKTTIADYLNKKLLNDGYSQIQRLDGDIIRNTLTKDLGFSKEDRKKNIERVTYLAGILSNNNIGVLASFISPYMEYRKFVKDNVKNFIEVYIDTSLKICEERDTKGLYKKARNGEILSFTGISDPYETPNNPDIYINTENENIDVASKKIYDYLINKGFI